MITMTHPKVTAEQFQALTAPLSLSEERTAASYWLTFCAEWNNLAIETYNAGQDGMADFLGEMSDEAADFWTRLVGH